MRAQTEQTRLRGRSNRRCRSSSSEDRIELAAAIHDYIELIHNTRRRHSSLIMLTPTEYEDLPTHQRRRLTPEPQLHDFRGRSRFPRNPGRLSGFVAARRSL
ncbi:IS3 family transposase [Baekduia sp.]|uniref:IS3 family transposase n=1 Tax=Baekduia sp. TaxID=2600305 RepID=UPI0032C2204B